MDPIYSINGLHKVILMADDLMRGDIKVKSLLCTNK